MMGKRVVSEKLNRCFFLDKEFGNRQVLLKRLEILHLSLL